MKEEEEEEEKSKKESEYYIEVGLCLGIAFRVVFDIYVWEYVLA